MPTLNQTPSEIYEVEIIIGCELHKLLILGYGFDDDAQVTDAKVRATKWANHDHAIIGTPVRWS